MTTKIFANQHNTYFPKQNQVICISGATAVGKSSVAVELCKLINGEIVVADSVQIYKHLNIGSNTPTREEQDMVPHHLIDYCDPSHTLSTAEFSLMAANIIKEILSRNKTPIVVGGATMWIEWLMHGIPDAPKPNQAVIIQAEKLLKEFEDVRDWEGGLKLFSQYDTLSRIGKLSKNDWYRLRRYLQVELSLLERRTSTTDSNKIDEIQEIVQNVDNSEIPSSGIENKPAVCGKRQQLLEGLDLRCFFLTDDREYIYRTIDKRCLKMLEDGLLSEVAGLIINDIIRPEYPVSKAIGYRQAIDYLCDQTTNQFDDKQCDFLAFDTFLSKFSAATRNYCKRQFNWYYKDKNFLHIRVDREASNHSVKTNATKAAVTEILHWCNALTAEEFISKVGMQMSQSKNYSEKRQRKRLPYDYKIVDELDRQTIAYMIYHHELRTPSSEEMLLPQFAWYREIVDRSLGITPDDFNVVKHDFTADAEKKERLREYRSKLQFIDHSNPHYLKLIDEAKEIKNNLFASIDTAKLKSFIISESISDDINTHEKS
eukprot:gene8514-11509_t